MQDHDWIGWCASLVLVVTLLRQVQLQWRDGERARLSSWLFVGQIVASIAFVVYSVLLQNWVFVFTNSVLTVTAALGQVGRMRARQRDGHLA